MRSDKRNYNELRPVSFKRNYTKYSPGSVLVEYGDTKVLVCASLEERVPHFLKDSGKGWLSAEYSLLPSSTHTRSMREAAKGKQSGRTQEIQRLIGRSLRSALDFEKLGERVITIDADVIQADGGTRTAAITGGMVALYDAVQHLLKTGAIKENPIKSWIAAVSVGLIKGVPHLDLCYEEDFAADTDMNVVMTDSGEFIEVQGTAEEGSYSRQELMALLDLADSGIRSLFDLMKSQVQ